LIEMEGRSVIVEPKVFRIRPQDARRAMTWRGVGVACLLAAVVSGCGSQNTASTNATASPRCGQVPPGSASYSHVIWVWMENQSYEQIVGSSSAPYLNSLARQCGLATNYHNITHPSLPNYIAATSGLAARALRPFRSDCNPSARCSTKAPSIFAQSPSWRAYEESMPSACDRRDSGDYAARHNPSLYYTSLGECSRRDLPLTALAPELADGSLPAFSFLTPNLCHDTHDCSVAAGDRWLADEVSQIVGSRAYRSGHTVLFITWDEGEGGSASDCASNEGDVGCHVATLIVSPSTPASRRSGELFNHYSLLRTSEELLGLPYLGRATQASSMVKAFGLGR
jgi:phosphatidylinositol-3-phosphatase